MSLTVILQLTNPITADALCKAVLSNMSGGNTSCDTTRHDVLMH